MYLYGNKKLITESYHTIMICLTSHPKMKKSEINEFRKNFCRLSSNQLTRDEIKFVAKKKENMKRVTKMITSKNGGKNPILGY